MLPNGTRQPSPKIPVINTPTMLFDGKSVGDAGACAAILLIPNGRRFTVSQFLSKATNDEAEYRGLIIGLEKAQKLGIRQLDIKGDSQLVITQIIGSVSVTEKHLVPLYQQALKLMGGFTKTTLQLISPQQNRSAVAAVNRCLGEALGIDAAGVAPIVPQMTPNVARLIKLGSKATEEDYKKLIAERDDFTVKSLSELTQLVPTIIRDEIALRWDGEEDNLAEIYRWYLRGLSPDMSIRKVQIDTQIRENPDEKLPWEGELLGLNHIKNQEHTDNPFLSSSSVSHEESTFIVSPALGLNPDDFDDMATSLDIPSSQQFQQQPELTLRKTDSSASKDTIPSVEKINYIVDLIQGLSRDETVSLLQELVKSSGLVTLMLKSIAEQMSTEQSQ